MTVLVNTVTQPTVTFTLDETPQDPDSNTATVTITRLDGTLLGSTNQPTARIGTGIYRVTVPAQTAPDVLTLAWTGLFSGFSQTITTEVVIVGGRYFTLAELRNSDGVPGDITNQRPLRGPTFTGTLTASNPTVSNVLAAVVTTLAVGMTVTGPGIPPATTIVGKGPTTIDLSAAPSGTVSGAQLVATRWSTDTLAWARDGAELEAERIMCRSFVRRAHREWLTVRCGEIHPTWSDVTVRAAWDRDGNTVDTGAWRVAGPWRNRLCVGLAEGTLLDVVYEHGASRVPTDVRDAVMDRARWALGRLATTVEHGATELSRTTDAGTTRFVWPTASSTEQKPVDAVYARHSRRIGIG